MRVNKRDRITLSLDWNASPFACLCMAYVMLYFSPVKAIHNVFRQVLKFTQKQLSRRMSKVFKTNAKMLREAVNCGKIILARVQHRRVTTGAELIAGLLTITKKNKYKHLKLQRFPTNGSRLMDWLCYFHEMNIRPNYMNILMKIQWVYSSSVLI